MHKNTNARIREHFDKIGKDYDAITDKKSFQYYINKRKDHLKDIYRDFGNDRIVVDLASGTGAYSESICNNCFLVNMDLSLELLKANRSLDGKVSKVNANALRIPLKENSVDSALLIGLLHHVPDRLAELFAEIKRILKPGGTIVIDEPNGYNPMWFIFMKCCEIDRVGTRPLFPHGLRKIAKKNSLKVEGMSYWGFVPPLVKGESAIKFFDNMESYIAKTFLRYISTRYQLILRK